MRLAGTQRVRFWVLVAVCLSLLLARARFGFFGMLLWMAVIGVSVLAHKRNRASIDVDRGRDAVAMMVSVGVAEVSCAIAVVGLRNPELGLWLLAAGVASALRWLRARRKALEARARARLLTARSLLEADRCAAACDVADDAALAALESGTRNEALTVLALAAVRDGQPGRACEALRRVAPPSAVDPYALAAVESANGRSERAIALLDRARQSGRLDRPAARLLIDLLAAAHDYRGVGARTLELSEILGSEDVHLVVAALRAAGEPDVAARLATAYGTRLPREDAGDVVPIGGGPRPTAR
jgi:hypothetical protein